MISHRTTLEVLLHFGVGDRLNDRLDLLSDLTAQLHRGPGVRTTVTLENLFALRALQSDVYELAFPVIRRLHDDRLRNFLQHLGDEGRQTPPVERRS